MLTGSIVIEHIEGISYAEQDFPITGPDGMPTEEKEHRHLITLVPWGYQRALAIELRMTTDNFEIVKATINGESVKAPDVVVAGAEVLKQLPKMDVPKTRPRFNGAAGR
jgi:nitrous oxidase accessory protein NosD